MFTFQVNDVLRIFLTPTVHVQITLPYRYLVLWIRIRNKLKGGIRIQINVISWIRIRIKVIN